jgi:hypothetical protein
MGIITSDNADRVGSTIALILSLPIIWILWKLNVVSINFSYSLPFVFMFCLFFLAVFFVLRFVVVMVFFDLFNVIPWTYGDYTNNEFGFSTSIPLEFTNMPELHPPNPGLIIHARDKSKFVAITIFAGSHYYGDHPSMGDIEMLEKRVVEKEHGRLESMERISFDHTDAVKTISEIQSIRAKKIVLVRDGVEYIIICSAPAKHFSVFDPAFEKLFNTLSWTPKK